MPPFVHCSAETVACCNPAQRHARTTRRPSARTAWRPHAIRAAPEGLQKVGTRSGEAARDVWRAAGADERWRATSARPARRAARPAPDASAASLSLPPLHPRSHRATSRTAEQGPRSCGFPAHLAGRCFPLTATTAPRSHACQGGGRWRWLNPRLGMTKQQDCRHARRRRCPASVDGILPRRPQGVRADAQVPPSLKKVMASTQPAVQWHHVASWVGVAKAGHAVWARGGPKGSARDWLQSQTAGRQERTGAEGSLPCWRGRCSFYSMRLVTLRKCQRFFIPRPVAAGEKLGRTSSWLASARRPRGESADATKSNGVAAQLIKEFATWRWSRTRTRFEGSREEESNSKGSRGTTCFYKKSTESVEDRPTTKTARAISIHLRLPGNASHHRSSKPAATALAIGTFVAVVETGHHLRPPQCLRPSAALARAPRIGTSLVTTAK
ncbi:unnamed protein product [Prorocentrum cordatum]|uniref:Uncharacterized protein n=1 Tax=Prorocentrum cordatum TaxID=2364126 RepID=A0ABN9TKD3_9DINO|nr:unnamed protein product [Polarella glacialis]